MLTSPSQGRPVYKVDLSRDQKEEGEVCHLKKEMEWAGRAGNGRRKARGRTQGSEGASDGR